MRAQSGLLPRLAAACVLALAAAATTASAQDSDGSTDNATNGNATQNEPLGCPPMHVIAARETTAPPGFGSARTLVDLITNTFPGTTSEAVIYPAAGDANYSSSVTAGVLAVLAQATQFVAQCPETILIMHGYSQGAQIMDSAFCGGPDGASLLPTPSLVQPAVARNVAAIIMMGNPRHVAGLAYNVGNATEPGVGRRRRRRRRLRKSTRQTADHQFAARPVGFECPQFQDRIQSYCDAPDPFCAKGNSPAFHQGYGKRNGTAALQFVVSKLIL